MAPEPTDAEGALHGGGAAVRLAGAAVAAEHSGRAPTLGDPFGGELRVTEAADGLRIESRGPGGDFPADRYRIELAR